MFKEDGSWFVTCPVGHVGAARSQEAHCPSWCDGQHDALLWLDCCDVVVHSLTLAATNDNRMVIMLQSVETQFGLQLPLLQVETEPGITASVEEVEAFARLLDCAAARARETVRVA